MFKEEMEVVKQSLQTLTSHIESIEAQYDAEVAAAIEVATAEAEKAGYDKGFEAGAASIGSDKLYSQVELDTALEAKANELKAQFEVEKAEAVAQVKADLKAKVEELMAAESEIDKQLADLFA